MEDTNNIKLSLNKISKSFNKKLFDNFNCEFKFGNIYLFQGESGCGKTTLLSIICGHLKPDTGNIAYYPNKSIKNEITYFSSNNEIFYELSILDNLRLVSNKIDKIKSTLKDVNLNLPLETICKTLSKGETAKLAIARMILQNKKILVFDEPTGNLDDFNTKIIFELFSSLKKNHIIIISSHDCKIALDYSDVVFTYIDNNFVQTKFDENEITNLENTTFIKKEKIKYFFSKPFINLCKSLSKKTWKQNTILFILNSFLLFVISLCFSFLSSNSENYIYKSLSKNNINGVVLASNIKKESTYATGTFINFENGNQKYFAIYNDFNTFKLKSKELKCTSNNGIVIPSNIANNLNITIGSQIKLDNTNTLLVNDIYEYTEINKNIFNDFNISNSSILSDYNYPILISKNIINNGSIQNNEVSLNYGSTLIYEKGSLNNAMPYFLSSSMDANTSMFWYNKDSYNKTIFYILIISICLFIISSIILIFTITLSFKNQLVLLKYIDNKYSKGVYFIVINAAMMLLMSWLVSSLVLLIFNSQFNTLLANFFIIKNIIPIIQEKIMNIVYSFLIIIGTLLTLIGLQFILSKSFFKNKQIN